MDRLRIIFFTLPLLAALGGCSSGPKPPPEPDMSRLVIVNKTVPPELIGTLPVVTQKQDEKK